MLDRVRPMPKTISAISQSLLRKKGWLCKTCGKHFETKHELYSHRQESGELTPRTARGGVCPICGEVHTNKRKHNLESHKKGPHKWTDEEKKHISEMQLKNERRRIIRYTVEYNGNLYDSSWEVEFAKRLESLGIDFERPKELLKYTLEGIEHNYFPDFWIPSIQKFVEVKNLYLFENDPKVKELRKRNDIIWLTSLASIKEWLFESA